MRSSTLFFSCVAIVFIAAACGDAGSQATDDVTNGGDAGQLGDGAGTDGSVNALGDASSSSDSGASPMIARSFDGDQGPGLTACQTRLGHCDRPEMNAAANGSEVVQVSSQNVTVFDYNGTVLSTTSLPSFITNVGLSPMASGGSIEPHVVYDEFIQRWVVTTTCLYDCIFVSATSDAKGAWAGVYLDNYGSDPAIHLGYDKNGVYLEESRPSTNPNASQSGYAGVLFAIPGAEMQWTGTFNPTHRNRAPNMPFDAMPVIDQNLSKLGSDPAFFVAKTCTNNCQNATNLSFKWVVNTVTWSGTTATYSADQLVQTAVGSATNTWLYNTPVAAVSQPGTAVQVRPIEGHRLMNLVQNGSHLYGALGSGPCASGCGSQGIDSNNLFFWADLDCSNPSTCTVSQTGKVSDPKNHLGFATIGVASNGNVSVVAASLSGTTYPTILSWNRATTDPAGRLNGPIVVSSGTTSDTCINNPVSFASAVGINTVRDPLDPTKLWTSHQYSNSSAPCTWATRVIELAP